ncbi:uncharacterized protein LOC105846305 [Hydra vulgaris]|uniref:uncharacterized protein LOC105846305 n=1 Tax=Hydra vulgaris TaxID=6087 RepID=UPI001F5F96D3|nr:uncharacterized protein LOC105846305 [Hydra vulgaris]
MLENPNKSTTSSQNFMVNNEKKPIKHDRNGHSGDVAIYSRTCLNVIEISFSQFHSRFTFEHSEQQTDQSLVESHLLKLDPNKSFGTDCVSPLVLQKCAKSLAKPLSLVFQHSIDQSELPESWLEANVTPLYKKGCKINPANYRLVFLTSVTCKTLEKIIRDKITKRLSHNNLISSCHYGLVTNKSSVTNFLETMAYLTLAKSNKKSTDIIFLDYAKAFDKVPHKPIIFKLERIVGKLFWINSFLSNRRQRIVIGEAMSD